METKEELEKQLGDIHSFEVADITSVINTLNNILESKKISPLTLDLLEDCENLIRSLKFKYTKRIISLLRTNHKLD